MLKSVLFNKIASNTKQIDIEAINDGILKLPNNRYRSVLSVGSINFELKSEEEQDAIIDTYEGFLNSLGFAVQLLIRTREIDIDDYLQTIKNRIKLEAMPIYRTQLGKYIHFISSLITSNKILSRQFYIIIPFDTANARDLGVVREQLLLRADIVSKYLARLGISSRELHSIELIDLFYSFYSPEQSKIQPVSEKALEVMNSEFIVRSNNNVKS